MERDPLVYGPSVFTEAKAEVPAAVYNPNLTNPVQDLAALFFRPKRFFESFSGGLNPNSFLVLKAIAGLVVTVWLAEFVSRQHHLSAGLSKVLDQIDDSYFQYFQDRFHLANLKEKFIAAWIGLAQLKMFLAPIFSFFTVLVWTASTVLVLPLFGVDRNKISFSSLFYAGCFVQFYSLLGVIPAVGNFLAALFIFFFSILAVKWIYRVNFWVALLASHLIWWAALILALIFVAFTALVWSAVT